MDKLITTAPELWQELAGTAQFDKREYDLEIQNEIRRRLGFPPTGNMLALLQKYNVSCEVLLDAVFHCIMPFLKCSATYLPCFNELMLKNRTTI